MPRLMMMFALSAVLGLSAVGSGWAAQCNSGIYRDIYNRALSLDRNAKSCGRLLKNRHTSISKICSGCKSTFISVSNLESKIRKNKTCFSGDRAGRRMIAELASVREAVSFMRRGCGY